MDEGMDGWVDGGMDNEWREPLEKIQVNTNAKFKIPTAERDVRRRSDLTPYAARDSLHGGIDISLHPHTGPHRGSFTWFGWMRANDVVGLKLLSGSCVSFDSPAQFLLFCCHHSPLHSH